MTTEQVGKGGTYGETQNRSHQGTHAQGKGQQPARAGQGFYPQEVIGAIARNPGRALIAWLAAMLGFRAGLALSHAGYLGVDGGAYLLSVIGDPHSVSFARPPLAPGYLLEPFMSIIGGPLGFNLYAAIFSMAVIPPFYLLARRLLGPSWGALATLGLSLDWPLAEMFVTGVVPITGFAALILLVWGLIATRDRGLLGPAVVAVAAPLVAFTNQTTLGLALVTVPIAWAVLPDKRRNVIALGIGGLLALSALPWYLDVLPGQPRVSYPGPLLYLNPWWSAQWYQLGAALLVGIATLRTILSSAPIRMAAWLLIVHGVLNVFLSYDEAIINVFFRSSYWMQIPLWLCVAWLVRGYLAMARPSLTRTALAAAVFMALGLFGFTFQFVNQANNYSVLMGPEHIAALESIDPETITRIGTNAESRGFYLAYITGKPVAWVQSALPAGSYGERERNARCSIGWIEGCAETGYLSHFLVDTNNRQSQAVAIDAAPDRLDPWGSLDSVPWLTLTYDVGTVKVYTFNGSKAVSG